MSEEYCKGYKLLDPSMEVDGLYPSLIVGGDLTTWYGIDKVTKPNPGCGALTVFISIRTAKAFSRYFCYGKILIFEVDGTTKQVETEIDKIYKICKNVGSIKIEKAKNLEESLKIWEARSLVGVAATRVREGYTRVYVGEDITVPLVKLPIILKKLRELSVKYDLPIVVFGHIGDSNLHPAITIEKFNPSHKEKLDKLTDEIHLLAINEGGVVTGEHGIGLVRAKYLEIERPTELRLMRVIKKAIDPKNIINPGKIDLDKIYIEE